MQKTFTVLVYDAEEGGYWAECLELGCGSQGETLDELDQNIREAIELVLEIKLEDGEDVTAISRARWDRSRVKPGVRRWDISIPIPTKASA
jgi:predicted RNase H-like HicB family nuclease